MKEGSERARATEIGLLRVRVRDEGGKRSVVSPRARVEVANAILRMMELKDQDPGCCLHVQGSAKRWALGCVNSPPWPEGARRQDSRNLGLTF